MNIDAYKDKCDLLEKEVERLKEKLFMEDQKQNESYRVPYLEKEVELLQTDKRELVEAMEKIDKIKINHSRYDEYVDAVRYIVINCLHKEAL